MPRIARPSVKRCSWKQDRWLVDGLRDDQGKRFRRIFESKEAAKAWLTNHKEKSLIEGRAGLAFTDAQRADARRALGELADFSGATLTDAARHYADFLRRTKQTVTVAKLIEQFNAAKKADGRSDRYLADLRARLKTFSDSFGDKLTAAVTTRDLDDWLRGLPLGPQSRVNYRRVLHALFNFACARGYAQDNPATRTEKPKVVAKEPGILTPAQVGALLDNAAPALRPALAIGAFAGLRPAEIHRLTWDAVNLEERLITVSAQTAKTASRRIVPICDNLLAWLMQAPTRKGRVTPKKERELVLEARKNAGIEEWPTDALRHSWVSYRFALTGDAARTAAEAGHDQAILHRHYRALATKAEAEKWFSVTVQSVKDSVIQYRAPATVAQ